MARQIEFADDLRPQQRHDVRGDENLKPGKTSSVTAARRDVAASGLRLFPARASTRRSESVVPAADDDAIFLILLHTLKRSMH